MSILHHTQATETHCRCVTRAIELLVSVSRPGSWLCSIHKAPLRPMWSSVAGDTAVLLILCRVFIWHRPALVASLSLRTHTHMCMYTGTPYFLNKFMVCFTARPQFPLLHLLPVWGVGSQKLVKESETVPAPTLRSPTREPCYTQL